MARIRGILFLQKDTKGGKQVTTFVPITRFSRCKRYAGALIQCPNCNTTGRVYHLSWSELSCQNCKKSIEKYDWLIEKGKYCKEVN